MNIEFSIGDIPARLRRDPLFGGMKLVTSTEQVWLQHPLQLSTHFSLKAERFWERTISGHRIGVEKARPLLLAGVRHQSFRVLVDEKLVAEASGF